MVGINMDGQARDRVLRLIEEKDRLEAEIRNQTLVLETNNNVGMQEPLVDDQGFPRGDIDVYKVRHARHSILCLQNDHKAIMKRIEQGLAEVHSQIIPQSTSNGDTTMSHMNGHTNGYATNGHTASTLASSEQVVGENDLGIAKIAFVHDGSPADLGGLCEHDVILQFGSVKAQNFVDISQIFNVVGHSVGQNIQVVVRRDRHVLQLTVTPRPWAQPGLLGCQITRLVS